MDRQSSDAGNACLRDTSIRVISKKFIRALAVSVYSWTQVAGRDASASLQSSILAVFLGVFRARERAARAQLFEHPLIEVHEFSRIVTFGITEGADTLNPEPSSETGRAHQTPSRNRCRRHSILLDFVLPRNT